MLKSSSIKLFAKKSFKNEKKQRKNIATITKIKAKMMNKKYFFNSC